MPLAEDLMRLERLFWTDGQDAYLQHADPECLVVFAEMAQVLKREDIAKTAEAGRWRDVLMQRKGLVTPTGDCAVLSYEVKAKRADGKDHRAHVSSLYVRRDEGWKLAFHQQTAIEA
ncbi:MAG: DUF4440 domain-containing protein [Hyphomonadaceae bacterium]|nr:DUF4440 domain-containing protein [Hyphomonadaceae bacterium]